MQQDLECIYKSFEGCGSIYMALFPIAKITNHLNRYGIRAVVNLSPQRQLQSEIAGQFVVLRLPTEENQKADLKKPFQMCFQFIIKNKSKTNILICGPNKYLCLTFLFSYLMRMYKYNLAYISKLFENSIKHIAFPPTMLEQLRRLSLQIQNHAQEDDPEFMNSAIGRRIKRIRYQYPNLAKSSRSTSRSSQQQTNKGYETARPQYPQFTPESHKEQYGELPSQSPLPLKTKSRHVKRLSDYY